MTIDTPLGEDVLLLQGFTGLEGISQLFKFTLDVLSENNSVNFESIVGQNVTISVVLADQSERYFNGYVSRFAQSGCDSTFTHYQMEVVPWLWFLTRNADCRIFQNMTIPDIIQQVFTNRGFNDFKNSLTPGYDALEYCVQYRETDFNFVSRLMEQYGIFYFFEHENGKHTLVLGDSSSVFQSCPGQETASYDLATGGLDQEDVISSLSSEQELRTGKYSLSDYNFETPSTSLLSSETTVDEVDGNTAYEIYDYPGEYLNQSQGSVLARLRMQEEEASHLVISGSGCCRAFASGFKFDLENYYRDDMNTTYVLSEIQHLASVGSYTTDAGGSGAHYSNSFTCIPTQVPFRPPRVTPKPFVQGPQTALVVGKAGEEIWVDNYGRVKVQFYWDRLGKKNENSSCWIRVSQPWAGQNWGAIWIPRIGQEVIVSFLEGDPDRPIITGRVYNAEQMPPYPLPDNQTQSGFKSRSSKGGGSSNYNEIRFEDKKGSEDLLIHAERTMHNSVEASQFITVGSNRHITTGGVDKDGNRAGDVRELVFKYHNLHVKEDQRTKIEGSSNMHVEADLIEQIEGESHLHVQKDADATYDQNLVQSVSQKCVILADTIQLQGTTKIVLMAGASSIVIDSSGVTLLGTPMINLNSPGAPPTPESPPLPPEDPDDPVDP